MTIYETEQAAVDALIADGFVARSSGVYVKRSKTGGNLMQAPRSCVAVCQVVRNKVDPKWAAQSFDTRDYFTIRFL